LLERKGAAFFSSYSSCASKYLPGPGDCDLMTSLVGLLLLTWLNLKNPFLEAISEKSSPLLELSPVSFLTRLLGMDGHCLGTGTLKCSRLGRYTLAALLLEAGWVGVVAQTVSAHGVASLGVLERNTAWLAGLLITLISP
jgi:hypothetical protein